MSNMTKTISLLDIAQLSTIILTMDRYMIVILYITGIIGAILNIITFLQKQIRNNLCSVYFLTTSVVDFFIMNVFILMEIISTFNKPLSDFINSTRIWCKFGNYIMFLLSCLSSSYITLATIDRFCISSLNQTIRKWSNLKVSRIVVGVICMVWVLFGLHIPIAYDRIRDISTNVDRCTVETSLTTTFIIIDGFFFSLFNGAIVPLILCIFGLLIFRHVKQSRRRVTSQQDNGNTNVSSPATAVITRQNLHMIKMLLVQVFLTFIVNTPYIIIYLLGFYNQIPVDLLALFLVIIFSFIARWFYYMNYCKTFYLNTLTSKLFRNSLRKQFIQIIRHYEINIFFRSVFPINTNT